MGLSTLSDLRANIAAFGQDRTDIGSGTIDDFIELAEVDIVNGTFDAGGRMITPPLRVRAMETVNASFTLSGEYTNLPANYLEMRSVEWTSQSNKPPLKFVTPDVFEALAAQQWSGTVATMWTIVGSQIRVGPGASGTDVLTLIYYADLPGLVANVTNWLMTGYPNVYLYGALRHLAPYTGATEMLGVWQPAFVSAVMGLIRSQQRGSYSGTSMAVRSPGVTVR